MMASSKKRLFLKSIGVTGLLSSLCPIGTALAQLRVEIAGVGANQIPIAIGQFWDDPAGENQITAIVAADLQRSGLFRVIPSNDLIRETGTIDDSFWKSKGADALLGGSLNRADGRIEIRYRLHDTAKGVALTASGLKVNPQFIRLAAHRVADDVFEKLTGIRGPFATRIAYVARTGNEYRLEIADSDGENAFAAFRDSEPVISPAWSPDGSKIAYVSFGPKKPVVYVQELATRQRFAVANFKGSNSAPAWSPDGRRLAIALARDGLTQIHMVNADGTDLRRILTSNAIDTEPCFAPDGEAIYFTSDRSGSPQIYRMSPSGGEVRRVTFNGGYNISPAISPDGKLLSYISRRDGRFQVYVLELPNGQESRLSDGPSDESPSFAPNSRYIMYASKSGGRANLSVVAVDGSARYTLNAKASTIREPAWGPFTK
ncbi:MAG: Tol-Pal system beta propeller repeat protein TolB [Oxalobacteraceae bacterium]|nr:Tol-Pal system beta propeller repeat protein TolB [Oxalobacteraceae bacterium]